MKLTISGILSLSPLHFSWRIRKFVGLGVDAVVDSGAAFCIW